MSQQTGGFGGWYDAYRRRVQMAVAAQDERFQAMRRRAEENPADLNTAGFPDWVTPLSIREKKFSNAILGGIERKTGRDLSAYKED